MKIYISYALVLLISACSGEGDDIEGSSAQQVVNPPVFRAPTEEEAAESARTVEEYQGFLDRMEASPLVSRGQKLIYTGSSEDLMGDLAEQLRIGQLAFDELTLRGFNIKDGLRVLVEREGDIATVTLENPLLRDRSVGLLTASYTMQIILNSETGEILSALMGN